MKNLFFLLLLPVVLLFASCSDDGYSLNNQWISYATVESTGDSPYFYLRLDDSNRTLLWVAATNSHYYRPKNGQRIVANYTILDDRPEGSGFDHNVKLNRAYNILTKGVFELTSSTQDSIGYDPIGVNDLWVAGDYLTIEFYYGGLNKVHFVTLAYDASKEYNDGKVHLEFRHNANNDELYYKQYGTASFKLTSLQSLSSQSMDLVIHVKEYDNETATYELKYTYGNDIAPVATDKPVDDKFFDNMSEIKVE